MNLIKLRLQITSCNHQKSKLRAVAGAEGFWFAELRVLQLKIGSKSCFGLMLEEEWSKSFLNNKKKMN